MHRPSVPIAASVAAPLKAASKERLAEALPRHLWCLIAQYDGLRGLATVLRCCRRLLGDGPEVEALWHYQAFASGVARLASGPKSGWIYPFSSEVRVEQCIDWHQLLVVNRHQRPRQQRPRLWSSRKEASQVPPPVWVRVRDLDLRIPLFSQPGVQTGGDECAILAQLRRLLRLDHAPISALRDEEDCGSDGSRWLMRLRRLLWKGRPGAVLQAAPLSAGDHLLLEWAPPGAEGWPLPPCMLLPGSVERVGCWAAERCGCSMSVLGMDFYGLWAQGSRGSAGSSSTGGALQDGAGSAGGSGGGVGSSPSLPPLPASRARRRPALLRVASSLLAASAAPGGSDSPTGSIVFSAEGGEVWIVIDLRGALGDLYADITIALRQARPDLFPQHEGPVRVQLMDTRISRKRNASATDATPLEDLCWAESESVRIELEGECFGRQPSCMDSSFGNDSGRVLLAWREPGFSAPIGCLAAADGVRSSCVSSVAGSDDDYGGGSSSAALLQAALGGRRRMAPARARLWWREDADRRRTGWGRPMAARTVDCLGEDIDLTGGISDPPDDSQGSSMRRQLSEESTFSLADEQLLWHRVATDPAGGASTDSPMTRQVSMPAVDEEFASSNTGASTREDAIHSPAFERMASALSVSSMSSTGSAWEHVVPHHPPELLPGTDQARQFEFHPSLRGVMLTGDQRGGVRAIVGVGDEDGARAHEVLRVDEHPVVSLTWLRHSASRAACGIARTGVIRFLSYDWNAASNESALQEIGSLQAPAQISSLSTSCGDDYLLASGLSNSFTVYDLNTGKLVREARDAHEHFINVSRFSHSHPQILATVSLDHTCKLWDLRLPLTKDKTLQVLNTGGPNVMCAFSPDDRMLLCSGTDRRLIQFELPSGRRNPNKFDFLPPRVTGGGLQQYRRAMYFASGQRLVTAATDESHLRVLSTAGASIGVVNMRGVIRGWHQDFASRSRGMGGDRFAQNDRHHRVGVNRGLVRGELCLEQGSSSIGSCEYVQSVRTHPVEETMVGALMSLAHGEHEPYRGIALVRLDSMSLGVEHQT